MNSSLLSSSSNPQHDPHTASNWNVFSTKHIHLEWKVDFSTKTISGSAQLTLEIKNPSQTPLLLPKSLILDTSSDLQIHRVFLLAKHECIECKWHFDVELNRFSRALVIPLEDEKCSLILSSQRTLDFKIFYSTSPRASACQWIEAAGTAGKKFPFLFTQCQAIHARSLLPCQDTPIVKFSYSASVDVPSEFACLMSALGIRNEQCSGVSRIQEEESLKSVNGVCSLKSANAVSSLKSANNSCSSPLKSVSCSSNSVFSSSSCRSVYHFFQHIPIPSYLLALVVGNLSSHPISSRCSIWAEPEVLQRAAWEFQDTEHFLAKAEEIAGPYVWSRYDLLVLPPSFPYGGMENPCLTFITPSLLAGDKSLVDVVIHEISHSWTGNLVTAASNEHFWLNEGFTMFLERKILGSLYGEAFRQFDSKLGLAELREALQHFVQQDRSSLTKLVPNLEQVDPDDCFSTIPYEKGYNLLFTLETLIGADKWADYLRAHLKKFAFLSICTGDWLKYLREYFSCDSEANSLLEAFDWNSWLFGTGTTLPQIPSYSEGDELSEVCERMVRQIVELQADSDEFELKFNALLAKQKIRILDLLLEHHCPMSFESLRAIKRLFKKPDTAMISQASSNVEVQFRWLLCCLASKFDEGVSQEAAEFATLHGRMKYCRRIYRALAVCDAELARRVFLGNCEFYHPIARAMIEKDLGVKEQ